MRLENQLITLQQAKKLSELGVKSESLYYWIQNFRHSTNRPFPGKKPDIEYFWIGSDTDVVWAESVEDAHYPAYTVAELGEMLGKYIVMRYASDLLFRLYDEKGLLIDWIRGTQNNIEAQARAEALIWLLENNYITAQQINEAA